jgi:hypothetical protein
MLFYLDDVDWHDFLKTLSEASKNQLAGACLLSPEQPLPTGGGEPQRQPGGWHGLAAECLHHPARAKAERIINQELGRLGWQEADLVSTPKRDPRKLELAVRLRRETALSLKQIAERLHFKDSFIVRARAFPKLTNGVSSPRYPGALLAHWITSKRTLTSMPAASPSWVTRNAVRPRCGRPHRISASHSPSPPSPVIPGQR